MKRLTILLLAMAFAMGCGGIARADGIDVKVSGQWDFAFGWATNTGGNSVAGFADSIHHQRSARDADNFIARHRVRTQINFIASEYLQGVLMFEIGNLDWGRDAGGKSGPGSGAGVDADGVNVETKRAYLDWIIPETEVSVRMGLQGIKLPSGPLGSPIMDSEAGGIVVSAPVTDMVSLTAVWFRPFNMHLNDGGAFDDANHFDDEVDAFSLILPIKGDGWAVTPWGAYAFVGSGSGIYEYLYGPSWDRFNTGGGRYSKGGDYFYESDHAGGWWAGFNFELTMFDPLKFTFDAMYGSLHKNELVGPDDPDGGALIGTRGWFLDATLDYKLDWGTPGIFGWWSTGDGNGARDGQLGRMPIVSTDTGWQATTFGALGSPNIATEGVVLGSATGTWGIGAQLADMSFVQDLKHTIRVAFYKGTNSSENVEDGEGFLSTAPAADMYLTDKDHVIEVNFDHSYKIYENLTAMLELGYIHLRLDEDVWNSDANRLNRGYNRGGDSNQNAWKAQLQFQYKF